MGQAMSRRRSHPPAVPPVDVQLSFADGSIVSVDCLYVGWDVKRRTHIWEAINPRHEMPDLVHVAELPAATAIVVGADDE